MESKSSKQVGDTSSCHKRELKGRAIAIGAGTGAAIADECAGTEGGERAATLSPLVGAGATLVATTSAVVKAAGVGYGLCRLNQFLLYDNDNNQIIGLKQW